MLGNKKRAKIELLKNVLFDGKHTPAGTRLEMDRFKAMELVSVGQARFLDRAGDDDRSTGVRIDTPTHGDPGVRHLDPTPAKRGKGDKE